VALNQTKDRQSNASANRIRDTQGEQ